MFLMLCSSKAPPAEHKLLEGALAGLARVVAALLLLSLRSSFFFKKKK